MNKRSAQLISPIGISFVNRLMEKQINAKTLKLILLTSITSLEASLAESPE